MIKSILVPVDGSQHSKRALEFACDIANKYQASLHLLHVVQDAIGGQTMVLGSAAVYVQASPEEIEKSARSVLDAAVKFAEENGTSTVTTQFAAGSPVREILDCADARDVDTIIIGSRGLSDFAGLFLGSVSHQVAHHAKCTCITVR